MAQTVMALVVAGVLVWLAFGFTVGSVDFVPLSSCPAYWTAFVNQLGTTDVRVVVAFGKLWTGRQLWYFPLNILIKNPLPLLVALSVGVAVALRRRPFRFTLAVAASLPGHLQVPSRSSLG